MRGHLPCWIVVLFISGFISCLHAADWPQFRGGTGLGICHETDLPLSWNAKTGEGIAWKTSLPKSDNGFSSPIVSSDRIFVTCAVNHPLEHRVLCFNRQDGSLLWNTSVEPGQWLLKDLRGGYG